ncbi:histidine triad (HIT) family protein [Cupriavidus metallidurans]|jgi:histidine triad (HIT) family protein|uniref:Diadenosine tetraphosphate (Ap4A) hydrolase or other HIT (Histidine triad) family hydrolase n=2 Tax=Cupriavidus metallidurans TaxID=119219 RepID=Q1LIB6_CUPMC|nr:MULTISPECIES: histidine triad nucleotide-binding protein [Cupriavidus]PCH58294.1 MAG: histidine triad nucleotide-binding protein [Burkholderiaceae bacterium]ABF10110.1 diadenosine tetraphosphate (Ap4A) hydrolase or other HIT (histidine triad) family hydrolase [Cupriavidus metallidurans CH34]AVA37210.1 histidine triad nucleotide-binding protein [Cupriavidus metallidurans]ELA00310.1 diadenosine tetraphosphate (Ap4A) hydrolase-like protein [Cupriavidus sp. HMR-1]KWR77059.1 histidine triad nucl
MKTQDNCIFCKIVAGQIPSNKVYEDEDLLAFHDIHPKAPVHFLLIPKSHVDSLADCGPGESDVLARMMLKVPELARQAGCNNGFRTVINTGTDGGQEVFHLHIHVMGGPRSQWKAPAP